jgi:amyloid beta precursor protein binding protein 1
LQNVYRAKAQHDIEAVMTRVERLLLNINKPYDFINEQQVKLFCKNAYFLKVIKYRSLAQEYDPQTSNIENLMGYFDDIVDFILLIYIFNLKKYPF